MKERKRIMTVILIVTLVLCQRLPNVYAAPEEAKATINRYDYSGWHTQGSNGVLATATDIIDITNYPVFSNQWAPKTPAVIFFANGGNLEESIKRVTYGSVYGELPIPTRENYTFDGWYTTLNGTVQIKATTINTRSDVQLLYARWIPDTYIVSYDANGGTVSSRNKTVIHDGTYGTLPTPTYTGYDFLGWYTASIAGSLIDATTKVTFGGNHTLYAHWDEKNISITFDANGGLVGTETIMVPYGGVYGELPIPILEYWTFNGWYTDPKEGVQIYETDTVTQDNSFTLYAHWILKGEVTETFEELLAEYYEEYLEDRILPELINQGWEINSIEDISLMDDYDGDGLTLDQEYRNDTNPFVEDTDLDQLSDYLEVMEYGTDPLMNDTDGDGINDQSELTLGLDPLSMDSDGNGINDSSETITQTVDLEISETFDISKTLVIPIIEITGVGDYLYRIYAESITENLIIDELGCVVGTAFEFLHDDSFSFEKSTLSFGISDEAIKITPIDDLAIAYYDFDNQVLEVLETTYKESDGKFRYIISAEVDHYSTFMVVNKKRVKLRN